MLGDKELLLSGGELGEGDPNAPRITSCHQEIIYSPTLGCRSKLTIKYTGTKLSDTAAVAYSDATIPESVNEEHPDISVCLSDSITGDTITASTGDCAVSLAMNSIRIAWAESKHGKRITGCSSWFRDISVTKGSGC